MIQLSNGHSFEYVASSGALGFDGKGWPWERPLIKAKIIRPDLFTVFTKTLTLKPIKWRNPLYAIKFFPNGVANAVGLSNPGVYRWCKKVGPKVNSKKIPLAVSIAGEPKEIAEMAKALGQFDLVGIEVNVSCPNAGEDRFWNASKIVDDCIAVRYMCHHPVILKLSVAHDLEKIVPVVSSLVEAFSVNSAPWKIVFPNEPPPFPYPGGGVSGKIAQPFNWGLVSRLAEMTDVPVIGPGVWNFEDIAKLREIGAKAIGFGSIFLRYPLRPTDFVLRDKKSLSNT